MLILSRWCHAEVRRLDLAIESLLCLQLASLMYLDKKEERIRKHFLELHLSGLCEGKLGFLSHPCLLNVYHLTTGHKGEVQTYVEVLLLL